MRLTLDPVSVLAHILQTEGDTLQWTDPITGLACHVQRMLGRTWPDGHREHAPLHLCGYVTIPGNVPKWWTEYNAPFQVHGGITYLATGAGTTTYGFDTAHAGDCVPARDLYHGTYRDMDYCYGQTTALAAQLAKYFARRLHNRPKKGT